MSERERDFLPILGGKALNSNIIQHNKMARVKKGKKEKNTQRLLWFKKVKYKICWLKHLLEIILHTIVQSIRFIITQWNNLYNSLNLTFISNPRQQTLNDF